MHKRLQTIIQLLENKNLSAAIEESEALFFFHPSHEIENLMELIKKAEYKKAIEFCGSIKTQNDIPDHIDNIDITESSAHYEWEQKLNLAFNYKVF